MKHLGRKLIGAFLALALLIGGGSCGYVQYQASNAVLPELKIGSDSAIFAADGQTVLGHIPATSKSSSDQLADADISPLLRHVHMAAEDRSYYKHSAISATGLAVALLKDLSSVRLAAGGSTITQQYVKNAYLTNVKSVKRKEQELKYSFRLEELYSKDQILTKYLNIIYYGRGATGINDAARAWFGISATQLKDMNNPRQVAQAAFLASLINSPSVFAKYNGTTPSDLKYRKRINARAIYVLRGLREIKGTNVLVSQSVIDQAEAIIPTLKVTNTAKVKDLSSGDPYLLSYIKDWLVARQVQIAKDDGYSAVKDADGYSEAQRQGEAAAAAMLTQGGLRIVTTIQPKVQAALAKSVAAHLPGKKLTAGAVVQDPVTGAILAFYGGRPGSAGINTALYAQRQTGSTMKAPTLAAAVSSGISVMSELPAPPYIKINGSKIWNDDKRAAPGCKLNLLDAIALSNNPVHIEMISGQMASCGNPAKLMPIAADYPVSPASVAALARRMGADDSLVPGSTNAAVMKKVPSLTLGPNALSPLDVGSMYSTLANKGTHNEQYIVEKIVASDGRTIYQNVPKNERVLSIEHANIVNQALTGVFTIGTAYEAQIPGHALAGKTGTTPTDAWGVMFTSTGVNDDQPAFTCVAWMGYLDGRKTRNLWGADAMKICQATLATVLRGTPNVPFPAANMNAGRLVGLNAVVPQTAMPTATATLATSSPTATITAEPSEEMPLPTMTPRTSHSSSPAVTTAEPTPEISQTSTPVQTPDQPKPDMPMPSLTPDQPQE